MRRGIILVAVFVLLLAAPTAVRYFQFYRLGAPERTLPAAYNPDNVRAVPTPAAFDFVDNPQVGDGMVLLDRAHDNAFTLEEIAYLDGRLAQRGFEFAPYTGGDLAAALRPASAFVVVAPLTTFSEADVQAVSDFVERGGRLLLVGDPTRYNIIVEEDAFEFNVFLETNEIPLNSLGNEFDIVFNGDYLYNTVENEGNFRNIILPPEGLAESALTDGLTQLAFYGAHSLQIGSGGEPLLRADDNTWSSATDRPGGLALAALSRDERVLALGDIQFMTEPYYTVFDNGRFIAQIADFLTQTEDRRFLLADFPYFFSDRVNLVYTGAPDLGPEAFEEIITLQDAFRTVDKTLTLTAEPQPDGSTLYLGLYNQAQEVADILATAGISLTIQPPILTAAEQAAATAETDADTDEDKLADEDAEDDVADAAQQLIQSQFGNVQMSGTSLILLDEQNGRFDVVVLAASAAGLDATVSRLLDLIPLNGDNVLADCLLQETVALCPTNVADETVEAELLTGGAPETAEADAEDDADAAEEADEEETPPEEEEEEGEETEAELFGTEMGEIELDTTVEEMLDEDERHLWTVAGGTAVVDIVVESGDDFDAVLELYDADEELIESADNTFTGGVEELRELTLPDEPVTILVRDFYDDGGGYTLTVTVLGEAEAPPEEAPGAAADVFIFVDDDGTPLDEGIDSAAAIADLLPESVTVTVWVSTSDGPLAEGSLDEFELVVWDSGDYQDDEGLFGEDAAIILDYADNGGNIFLTGSAPPLLTGFDLAPVSVIEVTGDEPVLLEGFELGDEIALEQPVEAIVVPEFFAEGEEDTILLFQRGAEEEEAGAIVAFASPDSEDQKGAVLLVPFVSLPAEIQQQLMTNLQNWFALTIE